MNCKKCATSIVTLHSEPPNPHETLKTGLNLQVPPCDLLSYKLSDRKADICFSILVSK